MFRLPHQWNQISILEWLHNDCLCSGLVLMNQLPLQNRIIDQNYLLQLHSFGISNMLHWIKLNHWQSGIDKYPLPDPDFFYYLKASWEYRRIDQKVLKKILYKRLSREKSLKRSVLKPKTLIDLDRYRKEQNIDRSWLNQKTVSLSSEPNPTQTIFQNLWV